MFKKSRIEQIFNFMKYFTVFILLNVAPFSFLAKAESSTSYELEYLQLDKFDRAVWRVFFTPNNTLEDIGTGFFIGTNHFITTLRVIIPLIHENKDILLSQKVNSSVLKIRKINRVLAVSILHDFALLEVKEDIGYYLNLRDHPPEPSENLFLPAYSYGSSEKIRKTGDILYADDHRYDFPADTFYMDVIRGTPVLDEQGQVVGVVSIGIDNILIAAKINHLKEFIAGNTGTKCLGSLVETEDCIIKEVDNIDSLSTPYTRYKMAEILYHLPQHDEDIAFEKKEASELFRLAALEKPERKISDGSYLSTVDGYIPAQFALAYIYENDMRTAEHLNKTEHLKRRAMQWYEKAAEQGYVFAQYNLAAMYYYAQKDVMTALHWLEKAAEQGHVPSQYRLARYYAYHADQGALLQQHFSRQAFHWFEKAVEQRHAPSLLALVNYSDTGNFNVKNKYSLSSKTDRRKTFL